MSRSARTRRCSDSSLENPRSRKTSPVDDVTLTALFFAIFLPQLSQCSEALATDLQVPCGGLPRFLLECVQDVDSLCPRRHVEHPMCTADVNPDLSDTRSHGRHGLPIVRVESLLHTAQLETDQSPCESRKSPQS